MNPFPEGFFCFGCAAGIDANDAAFVRDGRHWCSERCHRLVTDYERREKGARHAR